MSYAYITGPDQPDSEIVMPEGQAIAGYAIGIITIDYRAPMIPGNVGNASTYNFPVIYKILKGASLEQIFGGDPALAEMVIEGGKELIQQGARAIVGTCGLFANYQKEAAAALKVPTYMSILLQVPFIAQSLRPDQKIGVITALETTLTPRVFDQCGINDPSRLVIIGARTLPEFKNIIECKGRLNSRKLEKEIVGLARQFVSDNPDIGAILLQCSDLPPYAWAIQNAVKLPVYDMATLIGWLYNVVVRQPFNGLI